MATRTNLMKNPSLEAATTAWVGGTNTAVAVAASTTAYGSQVLRVTRNAWGNGTGELRLGGFGFGNTEAFPVTPGLPYTFSAYFQRFGTGTPSVVFQILWYNTNGSFISGASSATVAVDATSKRASISAVAPANAATAILNIQATALSENNGFDLDGFLFEQTDTLGDYFDGSTVKAGFTYAWTGTPHASTSTETASVAPAPRTNLMPVPSSEAGSSSVWTPYQASVAFSPDYAFAGSQSLKVTRLNVSGSTAHASYGGSVTNGAPNSYALPITGGQTYTLSFYSYGVTSGVQVKPELYWSTDTTHIVNSAGVITTAAVGAWTRHTLTATAPANATKVFINAFFSTFSGGSVIYLDGFLLEKSSTVGDYFDGSTVKAGYTYAWSGTPHASTSTETVGAVGPVPKNPSITSAYTGAGTLSSTAVKPPKPQVVGVYQGASVPIANNTVTVDLPTAPQAGDVVFALLASNGTNATDHSIAGLGATWTKVAQDSGAKVLTLWKGVGATSSGTVTATKTSGGTETSNKTLNLWHLRGVTSDTVVQVHEATADTLTSARANITEGQIILGMGYAASASETFASPEGGWVTSPAINIYNDTRWASMAHAVGTSTLTDYRFSTVRAGSTLHPILQVVVGTPKNAPLPRRLTRWQTAGVTTANPSLTATFANGIISDQVILVGVTHASLSATKPSAISGLGMTWTEIPNSDNSITTIWRGTGGTLASGATGTITLTGGSDTNGAVIRYLHVANVKPTATAVSTSGAGTITTPVQSAGPGQVVFGINFTDSSAGATVAPSPAEGWYTWATLQVNSTRWAGAVDRVPTSVGQHSYTVQRTSGTGYISQVVLGEQVASYTPVPKNLSSTMSGEGTLSSAISVSKKRVLILSEGLATDSYLNTKQAFSDSGRWAVNGHTTGTTETQLRSLREFVAEQEAAHGKYNLIVTSRATYRGSFRTFLKERWEAGTPIIFGGVESGSAEGDTLHTAADFGLITSAGIKATSAANDADVLYNINEAHPTAAGLGLGPIRQVLVGENFAIRADGAHAGTRMANLNAGFPGVVHTVVDAGDTLLGTGSLRPASGVAPARAAFMGWVYAHQTAYNSYGKAFLLRTAHWLTSPLPKSYRSALSGEGTLASNLTYERRLSVEFTGLGQLTTDLSRDLVADFSGSGELSTELDRNIIQITSRFDGYGQMSATLESASIPVPDVISGLSGEGDLFSRLQTPIRIVSDFRGDGVLLTDLQYRERIEDRSFLGKLSEYSVTNSAVPLNPDNGSGSLPTMNATFVGGTDPEFAMGTILDLESPRIGEHRGEIISVSTSDKSDRASMSVESPLTLLNSERRVYPLIQSPSPWFSARAIDYWTQQCGLFYDRVPGQAISYASGFGHNLAYVKGHEDKRFYEHTVGHVLSQVISGRSVRSFGTSSSSVTKMMVPGQRANMSFATGQRLIFSVGIGVVGNGRTAEVEWAFSDQYGAYKVLIVAGSDGAVSAKLSQTGGATLTVNDATVTPGRAYRLTLSIEKLTDTELASTFSVDNDNLLGVGSRVYKSDRSFSQFPLPRIATLESVSHRGLVGGSGDQMYRYGTYLTTDTVHPVSLPKVTKVLGQSPKSNSYVTGFQDNMWDMLNQYAAITRMDVSYVDEKLVVGPRNKAVTYGAKLSGMSRRASRRDKYQKVALMNQNSKVSTSGDEVLWRADSVYQVNTGEVFETTIQTDHSILELSQPTCVTGITPFPYEKGTGQYVITGADGYIVSPEFWADNGGKVEVELTDREGEFLIRITGPDRHHATRAPYRVSEGAGDRPALYVSGSGVINKPEQVEVNTGAKNAKEGYDSVFESPFLVDVEAVYDTAMEMAREYSASNAEYSFTEPSDYSVPSAFGTHPAGARLETEAGILRITNGTVSARNLSANASPQTTIADYKASMPAGSKIGDEKAKYRGMTIRQLNIKPLKGR